MRTIEIPGRAPLELAHLVLDVNGTLTVGGELVHGVAAGLRRLGDELEVHLLSADTFGTLSEVASMLGVASCRVARGDEKVEYVRQLGSDRCAAIGNGANDAGMLREAAVGIAVVGPEGAAAAAIAAADVVCHSIDDALRLLGDEVALAATLRL